MRKISTTTFRSGSPGAWRYSFWLHRLATWHVHSTYFPYRERSNDERLSFTSEVQYLNLCQSSVVRNNNVTAFRIFPEVSRYSSPYHRHHARTRRYRQGYLAVLTSSIVMTRWGSHLLACHLLPNYLDTTSRLCKLVGYIVVKPQGGSRMAPPVKIQVILGEERVKCYTILSYMSCVTGCLRYVIVTQGKYQV